MANRVGRPTKEESIAKMELEFNPDHDIKFDGVLRKPQTQEGMSIKDWDKLQVEFEHIISNSLDFNMQPALINFGMLTGNPDNARYFYQYYNFISSLTDIDKIGFAAQALVNEFKIVSTNRFNNFGQNLRVIAYHFRMKLDLRKINHNYSMIYQIIADMNHRTFGNYFLATYFITKPSISRRNPEIVLEIIISNAALFTNKLLSTNTGTYFDSLVGESFGATNRVYTSGLRNCNENNIPVYNVFDNVNVPKTRYKANPQFKYRELYEKIFGPEIYNILPKEATNMKPGYFPDTEKLNMKKRERRIERLNTEEGYLNS